jgi:hypothetical protein
MPTGARRKGSRNESVESVCGCQHRNLKTKGSPTFSTLPLKPTNVPRRVYKFCEAARETERSEKGEPTTSNRASANL